MVGNSYKTIIFYTFIVIHLLSSLNPYTFEYLISLQQQPSCYKIEKKTKQNIRIFYFIQGCVSTITAVCQQHHTKLMFSYKMVFGHNYLHQMGH